MKTFADGTTVLLKDGRHINIKEYKVAGMYQGHDLATMQMIYFGREEVVRVVKDKKLIGQDKGQAVR